MSTDTIPTTALRTGFYQCPVCNHITHLNEGETFRENGCSACGNESTNYKFLEALDGPNLDQLANQELGSVSCFRDDAALGELAQKGIETSKLTNIQSPVLRAHFEYALVREFRRAWESAEKQ